MLLWGLNEKEFKLKLPCDKVYYTACSSPVMLKNSCSKLHCQKGFDLIAFSYKYRPCSGGGLKVARVTSLDPPNPTPQRALPTEAKVESGTSQSKSGTSIKSSNSGNLSLVLDLPPASHAGFKDGIAKGGNTFMGRELLQLITFQIPGSK